MGGNPPLAAGVQIGLVAAQTGGGIRQLHSQITDMAMPLLVQAFHQQPYGAVVVVAHRGKTVVFPRQHHHLFLPWAEHGRRQAGEAKQDHSVDVALLKDMQMLFHQPGFKLAFHHDRVETVLIQQRQHGAYRLVF